MVLNVGALSFFSLFSFCMLDELCEYIGCMYAPNVSEGEIYSAYCFSFYNVFFFQLFMTELLYGNFAILLKLN